MKTVEIEDLDFSAQPFLDVNKKLEVYVHSKSMDCLKFKTDITWCLVILVFWHKSIILVYTL